MAFFSQSEFQPKRKFRFVVEFTGMEDLSELIFMAKSATKPSYNIESTAHRFLNHEFKFPNIVQWQDVQVSFIDAVDPNVGSKFYNALVNTGYVTPSTTDKYLGGVTKANTTSAIGDVVIKQLDGGQGNLVTNPDPQIVDEWRLINAWITTLKFGEGLDYGSNDIVTVDIGLKYDFAEYSTGGIQAG